MTPPSDTLPKYFKDEAGYCYNATPALAKLPNLTPWDGAVDAAGYAVVTPEPTAEIPKPTKRGLSKQARVKPVVESDSAEE